MFTISSNCTCFVKVIEAFPPKFRTFATKLDPQPLVGRNGAWSEQDKLEIFLTLIAVIWAPSPHATCVPFNLRKPSCKVLLKLHGGFLCVVCVVFALQISFLSSHSPHSILYKCCWSICHAVIQIELRVNFAWMKQPGTQWVLRSYQKYLCTNLCWQLYKCYSTGVRYR